MGLAGCLHSLWSLAVEQSGKLNIYTRLSQSWRCASWRKLGCPASEENQSYYGVKSLSFLPYLTLNFFEEEEEEEWNIFCIVCEVSRLKTSTGKFHISARFDLLPLVQISCNLAPIKISKLALREKHCSAFIISLTVTANCVNSIWSFHFSFRRNMRTRTLPIVG